MIDQIKNPHPMWADVIHKHFKLKKTVIEQEIQMWIADAKNRQEEVTLFEEKLKELMDLISKLP